MVEGDEGYAEYDVSGNFLGDGSEYSMVDTGQPRPPLLSEMSKSSLGNSSHSSSSSSDWFGALGGGGRGGGGKAHGRYRHLLHLKKSHHKQEQQKRWGHCPCLLPKIQGFHFRVSHLRCLLDRSGTYYDSILQ